MINFATPNILQTSLNIRMVVSSGFLLLFTLLVIPVSSQTSIAWQKSIGDVYADKAITIFPDRHGNIIAIGQEPHLDFTGNLRDYMLLTKYDPSGNVLWKTYHDVQFETFSLPIDYYVGKHFYSEEWGDTLLNLVINIAGRTLQYRVNDQTGQFFFAEEIASEIIDVNLHTNDKVYANVLCSIQQACYGPDSLVVQAFNPIPDSTFNTIRWTFEMKQSFRTAPIQGHYDFDIQDIRFDQDGYAYLLVQIERWDFQFCTDCADAFVDAWCEVFKFDPQGQLVRHVNLKTAKAVVSGMNFIEIDSNNLVIQINDINAAGTKVLTSVYKVSAKELVLEKKFDLDLLYPDVRVDDQNNYYSIRNVFDANDPNVKGLSDILVSKYTSDGTRLWKQYFGGSSWEFPQGLAVGKDGGVYFFANSESNDFDVAENNGSQDMWLVKLTEDGTTGTGDMPKAEELSLSPNPAIDVININTDEALHISIYDLQGNLVLRQDTGTSEQLNIAKFPAGVYVVRGVDEAGKEYVSRIVKI